MFAKEKSERTVWQYVDIGNVLLRLDSMALDNAAAASGFAGTFAPHAAASDVAASRQSSGDCRRLMRAF
jgi:hypothetical protein